MLDEPATSENKTIVNVSNFGVNMTNDRLRIMFEKYGTISSYGIMNDHEAWHRFAYVAFEDSDAADEAVIEMNGQRIDDNRRIRVKRTRKKEKNNKPKAARNLDKITTGDVAGALDNVENSPRDRVGFSVFVKNLEKSLDRYQLRKAFEGCGTILETRIIMDRETGSVYRTPSSKGYGFVTFATEDQAQKAVREMSGRLIGTQIVSVEMARGHRFNSVASGSTQRASGNLDWLLRRPTRRTSAVDRIARPRSQPRPLFNFGLRENQPDIVTAAGLGMVKTFHGIQERPDASGRLSPNSDTSDDF